MIRFYRLLCIFLLTSTICLISQEKNCHLYKGYWIPELSQLPKSTNVRLNNLDYVVYYRYHIYDTENKFYIESIESVNDEDINQTIKYFGDLNKFMNMLMVEFIQQHKSEFYKWQNLNDSNKVLSIDIIQKIYWVIINKSSSNNKNSQFIIPCTTEVCYYMYITINQTKSNTTLSIKEYEIDSGLNYYGNDRSTDSDCISIIKDDIKR